MKTRSSLRLLATLFLSLNAATVLAAGRVSPDALRLVDLTRSVERESAAIRFMLNVAPMALPQGIAECMEAKAAPRYRDYYAKLYATQMKQAELRQAIGFFEGEDGRAAIAFVVKRDADTLLLAQSGQSNNGPAELPPNLRRAVDAFGATPAGKHFAPEELTARAADRALLSDLRSAVMGECITGPAAKGGRG